MVIKQHKISTGVLWALTIVLVILILGGALYIRDKRLPETQPHPAAQVVADSVQPEVSKPANKMAKAPQDKSGPSQTSGSGTLSLSVPALWDGNSRLPLDHSCYRSNTSPQISWSDLPKGTENLVLFMDKVTGAGFHSYWVLFNIPANESGLSAALPEEPELANGTRYGRNDHGVVQYTGPCDPKGTVNYIFRLYALDGKLEMEAGAARSAIESAMEGHILDQVELPFIHYKRL